MFAGKTLRLWLLAAPNATRPVTVMTHLGQFDLCTAAQQFGALQHHAGRLATSPASQAS